MSEAVSNGQYIIGIAGSIIAILLCIVWFLLAKYLSRIDHALNEVGDLKTDVKDLQKFRDDTEEKLDQISMHIQKLTELASGIAGVADIKDGIKRIHQRMDESFNMLRDEREQRIKMEIHCRHNHGNEP